MLPNRTYNELNESCFSQTELSEEAKLRAGLSARKNRRSSLQLTADRKALIAIYKKMQEREEQWGALEALFRDFYIVERVLNDCDERPKRLPVLLHGSHAGLPRIYDIAACMAGRRDGRIDEATIYAFMEAYQSVTPLTMAEVAELPNMLNAALVKLLTLECERALEAENSMETAKSAAAQLERIKERARREAIIDRLSLGEDPVLCECLYGMMKEHDEGIAELINAKLQLEDKSIDGLCAKAAAMRRRSTQRADNVIRSLRCIGGMDWNKAFEDLSVTDRELRRDPVYGKMDGRSRSYYRASVERLSMRLGAAEQVIARQAVRLAQSGEGKEGQAGWYLFMEGRERLYNVLRPDLRFKKSSEDKKLWKFEIFNITLALLLVWLGATAGIAPLILAIIPAWTVASGISVRLWLRFSPRRVIPRIAEKNLTGGNKTLIVIPALVTDEKGLRAVFEHMENHYLATRLKGCYYAVLGDFKDGPKEREQGEGGLLRMERELTAQLNKKYLSGDGEPLFYCLHRHRSFAAADGVYMGRERKRGAICDLAKLICEGDKEPFCLITNELPEGIEYCITLDSDTILPPGAAAELIGCMEHPLNAPEIFGGTVRRGYGMIAPRMASTSKGAAKSFFARIISGSTGVDGYFPTAPEFYQDVFGRGSFGGKGIFHIRTFMDTAMRWIPENTVLSHDMLEGCFCGCGYAGDIALYDSEPDAFIPWWKRQHRWLRGDWQLLPFLKDWVKDAEGVKRDNPLSWLSKRKILDNLRRCMLPASVLYAVLLMPYTGGGWHIALALFALCDGFFTELITLPFRAAFTRNAYPLGMAADMLLPAARAGLDIMALPYASARSGDAQRRTLYRMLVSHRHMLEWQTAAQTGSRPKGVNGYYGALYVCPVMGIVMAAGAILGKTPAIAALFAALWLAMPGVIWALDRRLPKEKPRPDERELLEDIAERTWAFFETFAGEGRGYIPPDNFQQEPEKRPAVNTSPTNIGMAMAAAVSAAELGFITADELEKRLSGTMDTVDKMQKWHGHLYNWYRTDTLEVMRPRYVSTVDSGNFCACLITGAMALKKYGREDTAARLERAARETDFSALYDAERKLFRIGYDGDACELSNSWYDLLASEARLTSLIAVALGSVKPEHWFKLGRQMAPVLGGTLVSWSGTMFEYLMPVLFTGAVPDTLLYNSCLNAVKAQKRQRYGGVWGISESGYYAFDRNMYYQYRAFGLQRLSLMSHRERSRVISPYSTMLALAFDPRGACENIRRLTGEGGLGPYGMYEALDYTEGRSNPEKDHAVVQSFMAHHQGMSICAIANALCDGAIEKYFMSYPAMRAFEILTEERAPARGIRIKPLHSAESRMQRNGARKEARPRIIRERYSIPECQLLTNGSYTLFVTEDGDGFSKCGDIMLTRWRPDHIRGRNGVRLVLRSGNDAWDVARGAEAVFYPYRAEFNNARDGISCRMEICAAVGQNGEVRRITVKNTGTEEKHIELGAFFDVCLSSQAADTAHPSFNRLKVDAHMRDGVLLFEKRGKAAGWLYGRLISKGQVNYCADRLKALGRLKTPEQAMMQPMLQTENAECPVLPYFGARSEVTVAPGEGQELWFIMGYAESEERALEDCRELQGRLNDCFAMSEAQTDGLLRETATEYGKAELFERIGARLLLEIPIKYGAVGPGGTETLWKHGISGDRPVLLVEIQRITELRLLRSLMEFSKYMAKRLLPVDIIAVGCYPNEYRNELRERMAAIMAEEISCGRAHLINGFELKEGEKAALRCAAMVEIKADVSLNRQFAPSARREAEMRSYNGYKHGCIDIGRPELSFDNGLGGFDKNGEYVITLEAGQSLPMPWCNVIANDTFGCIVTERGGGHTWRGNSREHKLTPWYDSPADDMQGEFMLITDTASGETFSPFASLMQGRRIIRHGYGYSEFLSGDCGLKTKLTVFVHERFNVKYSVLSIANPGSSRRELSIMYGVEWALGPVQRRHGIYAYPMEYGICARNLLDKDNDETAYIALINGEAERCSDRETIFGRGWDADALTGDSGRSGASALRSEVNVAPGEEIRLVFALGEGGEDEIRQCLNEDTDAALDNVRTLWKRRLNGIEIHTPDAAMDAMMNGRLLYQAIVARVLGRCGYYQCGGAVGFRDQLQDMLAVMQTEPWRARQHILLCASKQFREGDVLHWWHQPSRGVRTRITDDRLFLPYVLWEYVHLTGDQSILTEQVSYLEGKAIPDGVRDVYDDFEDSSYTESLYQHCVRAVESIGFGSYGLPLMGGGDWNDGMDDVGRDGGESVWLGWFLLDVLDKMCCLAEICRKKADGKRFAEKARKLRHCVEQAGWDGAWYRRAYYGSGEPLGAKGNVACEIDCISQAWAAICGGEHADEAVNSMLSMLYDEQEGMIKLLTPPFTGQSWQRPGYIEDYIPGVRENGGQYTHGAVWAVQACCKLGMGEKALALFDALNPINHALTRAQAAKYKGEPYAVAGDVYSGLNAGRAGWTWYTGAAAWLYKICLEDMLGIRREKDALRIAPTVPFEEYTVKYRYGEAVYILHLSGKSRGTVKLEDDGMTHEITVG